MRQEVKDYIEEGNAVEVTRGIYATQDSMYRNRLTEKDLEQYMIDEYGLSEIYKVTIVWNDNGDVSRDVLVKIGAEEVEDDDKIFYYFTSLDEMNENENEFKIIKSEKYESRI